MGGKAVDEMVEGYRDGSDPTCPEPSGNRSHSYRHGFACARSDLAGQPAFGSADAARKAAKDAVERDAHPHERRE